MIFYIGFEMLMSKKSSVQNNKNSKHKNNLAISPLAIPIMTGPGTIVTAMNYVTDANLWQTLIIIAVFAIVIFMNYLAFIMSDKIVKRIGVNLIAVVGKLMGLILAIVGTGMLIEGVSLAIRSFF